MRSLPIHFKVLQQSGEIIQFCTIFLGDLRSVEDQILQFQKVAQQTLICRFSGQTEFHWCHTHVDNDWENHDVITGFLFNGYSVDLVDPYSSGFLKMLSIIAFYQDLIFIHRTIYFRTHRIIIESRISNSN